MGFKNEDCKNVKVLLNSYPVIWRLMLLPYYRNNLPLNLPDLIKTASQCHTKINSTLIKVAKKGKLLSSYKFQTGQKYFFGYI